MRITIDRDSNGFFDVMLTLLRGFIFLGRAPDELRRSSSGRGYHYIYKGIKANEDMVYFLRRVIGDDTARIEHDLFKAKGFKQVLFKKKRLIKIKGG